MTHAVILAGGWGERLWPMSTRRRPKQLLRIGGDVSLVRRTFLRIAPVVGSGTSLAITSGPLAEVIRDELPELPGERVIGEPVGRNTAPAIALAAHILKAEDRDAVLVVLPADHVVRDDAAFERAVRTAIAAATETGALLTLGIAPTRPETEYGYIEASGSSVVDGVREVIRFTEKPDPATAALFLEHGGYYWNSGMFVWRADAFLGQVERHLPDLARALSKVPVIPGDAGFAEGLEAFYEEAATVSVDYGIMEKAERVLVVPAEFGWDDIGGWPALARIWPRDEAGNAASGKTVLLDSNGCVVYSEEGVVAVLGMSDVVVARTAEATLVCPKGRAREVRSVVERLRKEGDLTE